MNEPPHIAHFEAQLERLVEGAFARLFRQRISAHDLAVQLVRSMTQHLRQAEGDDPRPVAPDDYAVHLAPDVQRHVLRTRPDLPLALAQHLVDLATQSGYRLAHAPTVRLLADTAMEDTAISVRAYHTQTPGKSTAGMQPMTSARGEGLSAQLMFGGGRAVPLMKTLVTVGRAGDNDIVLEDRFASRHHAQIRERGGVHLLFDVGSRSGTQVNGVAVRQHRLRSGDVIQIGNTHIVYVMDGDDASDTQDLPAVGA